MNRKYNIQLNLSPYSNYYEDGGNMGSMVYTPDENGFVRGSLSTNWTPQGISPNNVVLNDEQQDMVKSAERKQTAREKAQNFIDNMNGGGASGWNAIGPAAANISNAFLDTESDLADRTAAAMGMPALASIWKADWKKGNEALTDYRNKLNYVKKNNFIQDANSSWGAANAVKLNSKPIAPITPQSQLLTWKDFRGNMFMKGAGAVAQGAASGSVGGPWGALGGTITGLLGSLFGGIGAKKRAKSAYNSYLNKWQTLNSANQAAFNKAVTDQTLSNMQALANGNISQRISDMANIRAYGGNLYPDGGELTNEQQTVLADIQADPRILFTPEYSQWRDYIRRISPDYLDRLYTSLPYEQQQDIYQNDREAWGALSNETKGNFGGTQVRKKTDEVSPYVAGALGLVGAAPAMEAVTMFPMLENGLNAYFGYEGAKNLPTAITDAYDYAKKGDWSKAGLSVGEAALDALFLGQGLKGIRGISNTIKSKPSTETMEFYHGGLDSDFDFNNLDVLKLAEKQAKKGKDYAGFYMYDPSLKMSAYKYGEGIGAHKINIDRNAKVLDLGDVERVPRTEIQKYKDLGYDMLTGKDVRGRREYVLLNKDAIKNTEYISPEIIDKELSSIKDTPRIRFKDRASNDASYMPNTSNKISDSDWDNAYNAAIKSNDIEKAQRLRDAHFLENADRSAITKEGHPETIYHSVSPQYNPNFNSFNTKIEGRDTFVYATNNKNMSRSYTKGKEIDKNGNMIEKERSGMSEKQLKEAIKSEEAIIEHELSLPKDKQNSAYIKNVQSSLEQHRKELYNVKNKVFENYNADNLSTTKSLYGKLDNPWIIEGGYNSWGHIPTDPYGEMSTRDIERTIRHFNSMGDHRDGAIIKDIADWGSTYLRPESDVFTLNTVNPTVKPNPDFYGTVYSFENPQNLKYRDVITYDNTGNIIPLSKRDNFNINDFRYGLAPLLGLTGYGLVNNTKAMGGNLYTDLSPNMMSLWNNKQQIDQQKVNMQQMNFGLGNSFNYKNMFPDGGIIPPNRPLTKEEIDKLTQAEKEELAKKQAIRLYKELYAPSPALYSSREEDDEHTYNVLNRPDQNLYSSFDNIINLFKPSFNDYISNEQNKRKEAAEKAQQHSGGAFSWANGGQMTSADVPNGMQYYANGGSHEENPYGGIQVGTDQQGNANLVEKGEFRWHDFVFSDRVNVDANLLSSFNLMPTTKHQNKKAAKGKLSYADMAKKYAKRNKELENDPITKNSMEAFMQRLANAQEYQKKEAQLEAQKQNELQDYKTALNKQNNNPMYGNMKYNGMGNAATQQGVNAGVGAGTENPMSNADLSNVNRSGNEMMAAYGGNLYPIGGWLRRLLGKTQETQDNQQPSKNEWGINKSPDNVWGHEPTFEQRWEHPAIYMPNMPEDLNERLQNIGLGTYNGHIPAYDYDYVYAPAYGKGSNDLYGNYVKNQYLHNKYLSDMSFGSTMQPAQVQQNLDNQTNGNNLTFEQWRDMQYGNNNSPYMMSSQENIPNASVLQAQDTTSNDSAAAVDYTPSNISGVSTNIPQKTTTNTNPDAAVPSDAKEVPLYNTAGKYAQFGKGIMPLIWDWAERTNTKYDPYYVDANRLEALANEGPALRTADTIGGYRAPNLMDAERMNNAAQAQGLAALQSALSTGNGNRGFAAAQAAQNAYNTQMGIGNNYATVQQANNAERLQTDQLNHAIDVANQNAINAMRQDNQRAEQTQHQLAVSGTAQAANLRQNENFHADTVNTERMKNRAANQAAYTDNALNFFTTQAMENQELNARNNDPTNPYWIDKKGRVHYTGDSGLTRAIRDAFGDDEYGRNGTFTGERLTEWNNLIDKYKYSAKYLKEHPELWEHLVTQQREANKRDAEKAKQAKLEELEALRGTYQSNLARLDALRNSGAIISDPSYNLYAGWADEDYSGNQGLLRNRNQALDQYITQIGNNYDRYLYDKQLAQNAAKALGGYLNPSQGNNNNYYSYTRI